LTRKSKDDSLDACPFPPDKKPPPKTLPANLLEQMDRFFEGWRKYLALVTIAGIILAYSLIVVPPPLISRSTTLGTWNTDVKTIINPDIITYERLELEFCQNKVLDLEALIDVPLPFDLGGAVFGLHDLIFYALRSQIGFFRGEEYSIPESEIGADLELTYKTQSVSESVADSSAHSIAQEFSSRIGGTPLLIRKNRWVTHIPTYEEFMIFDFRFENTSSERMIDFIFSLKPDVGFGCLFDESIINKYTNIYYRLSPFDEDSGIHINTELRYELNYRPGEVGTIDIVKMFGADKEVIFSRDVFESYVSIYIFPPAGVIYRFISADAPFNCSQVARLELLGRDQYAIFCTITPYIHGESSFESWKIEFEVEPTGRSTAIFATILAMISSAIIAATVFQSRRAKKLVQ
jgi:hypothetical protein